MGAAARVRGDADYRCDHRDYLYDYDELQIGLDGLVLLISLFPSQSSMKIDEPDEPTSQFASCKSPPEPGQQLHVLFILPLLLLLDTIDSIRGSKLN